MSVAEKVPLSANLPGPPRARPDALSTVYSVTTLERERDTYVYIYIYIHIYDMCIITYTYMYIYIYIYIYNLPEGDSEVVGHGGQGAAAGAAGWGGRGGRGGRGGGTPPPHLPLLGSFRDSVPLHDHKAVSQ